MKNDSENVGLPASGGDPTAALPAVVDRATWQAERVALLVREKAHTREGDAIAAARRRLPMVEPDPTIELIGPHGPSATATSWAGTCPNCLPRRSLGGQCLRDGMRHVP
jgi:hypothetical protein